MEFILESLSQNQLFLSAALPLKIFPPLFNCFAVGEHFGTHFDNAIRAVPNTPHRIRTDLSCTLFLTDPETYDGGELVIEGHYGTPEVKLNAGDMVVYPSTSLHQVNPVTRGNRTGSFFCLQSMIRDNEKRTLLFDMDQSIQQLAAEKGIADPLTVSFSGVYHNLIRQWAEM